MNHNLKKVILKKNKIPNDNSSKIKMSNRNPYHGYNPGQDENIYKKMNESLKLSRKALKYSLNKSKQKDLSDARNYDSPEKSGDDFQPSDRSRRLYKKLHENNKPIHVINCTASIPDHPMVSVRKQKIFKQIKVKTDSKEKAISAALNHLHERGYKVHDYEYVHALKEGYYKNKDIENQELAARYKKALADSPNITKEGKKLVTKRLKELQKENLEIFEDWQEHKSKHNTAAQHYAEKIHTKLKDLNDILNNNYDVYELKNISRRLEDFYEEIDNLVFNRKNIATKDVAEYPVNSTLYKENLEENRLKWDNVGNSSMLYGTNIIKNRPKKTSNTKSRVAKWDNVGNSSMLYGTNIIKNKPKKTSRVVKEENLEEGVINNIKRLIKGKKVFGRKEQVFDKIQKQYRSNWDKNKTLARDSIRALDRSNEYSKTANELSSKKGSNDSSIDHIRKMSSNEYETHLSKYKEAEKYHKLGMNQWKRAANFPDNSKKYFRGK